MSAPLTLAIDAPAPWITANQRGSWRASAGHIAAWRAKAAWAAKAANLPAVEGHVRITAFVQRNHARGGRWDPANWYLTAKAAIDGLVDAGVLLDDSTRHVTGPDMRAGTVQPVNRLLLVIRRAEPETEPARSAS
jgi:hypothetical protein